MELMRVRDDPCLSMQLHDGQKRGIETLYLIQQNQKVT